MNHQQTLFDLFDTGRGYLDNQQHDFSKLTWHHNPNAEGVSLKHMVTADQTKGQFSYHLVNIEAGRKIPKHQHDVQLETHEVIAGSGICYCDDQARSYTLGTISILPAGKAHEVIAGDSGLCLFAKFMPALC